MQKIYEVTVAKILCHCISQLMFLLQMIET